MAVEFGTLVFVFAAGLVTALATGLGAVPFFLVVSEFIPEALEIGENVPGGGKTELGAGLAVGVAVMVPLAFL